jgi:transcriptional regulator with XRE-family HTH domain
MDIGYRIKTHRESLGLTQEDLAAKIGVSNKAVSKWETGAGLPDITQVLPLTEALGISASALFKPREPENLLKDFGGRLYELRRQANISREALEAKIRNPLVQGGLRQETMPRMLEYWETGKIIPDIRVLFILLPVLTKLFHVSENEIVSEEAIEVYRKLKDKEDDDDEEGFEVDMLLRKAMHPDIKDDFRCELLEDGLKQYPTNANIIRNLLETKTKLAARYFKERDDRAKALYREAEVLFMRAEDVLSDIIYRIDIRLARRFLANMYVEFGEYGKAQALIGSFLYADYEDADEIMCRICMHKDLPLGDLWHRKLVIRNYIGNLTLALQDLVEAYCRTGQPETAKELLKLVLKSSVILSGGEIESMADYDIDWVRLVRPLIDKNDMDLALDLLEILIDHEIHRPRPAESTFFTGHHTNDSWKRFNSDVKAYVTFKLGRREFESIRREPRYVKLLERVDAAQAALPQH